MTDGIYITISDIDRYYGLKPFEIGNIVKLTKDDNGEICGDDIRVEMPHIGVIGMVAKRSGYVAGGTLSAGRLYDRFSDVCYAQVCFTTEHAVIAKIVKGGHLHIFFSVDDLVEEPKKM